MNVFTKYNKSVTLSVWNSWSRWFWYSYVMFNFIFKFQKIHYRWFTLECRI